MADALKIALAGVIGYVIVDILRDKRKGFVLSEHVVCPKSLGKHQPNCEAFRLGARLRESNR